MTDQNGYKKGSGIGACPALVMAVLIDVLPERPDRSEFK
jgi:hypothetical protein